MELAHSKIDRKFNWIENHGSGLQASRKRRHHGESYNTVDARNSKVRIAILFFLSQLYQCELKRTQDLSNSKGLRSECPSSCKGSKRLENHIVLWSNVENRATEFRFIWRFVHFSRCLHDRLDRKIDIMKVLCTITLFWRRMIENSFEFTTGESRRMFTYYLPTDLSVFWYCLNKQPQRANWNHSACSLSSKMPNFCLGWLSKMS